MKNYIVTEGPADAELFRRVVGQWHPTDPWSVVEGGGKSSASSVARTLLARASGNVMLVLDADTNDSALIAQQRADFEASLGMVAPPAAYRVLLLVPELEALLLRDDVLREAGRSPLSGTDRELAHYAPSMVLARLLGAETRTAFVANLPDDAVRALASAPELEPLREFIAHAA
jgi:hypothetical protein